jgi:metabotropic X receptor
MFLTQLSAESHKTLNEVSFLAVQYYSVVNHDHFVSPQAFEELETLLAKHNICIAVKEKLVKDSGVADETAYDIIVQRLLTKPRARGEINYSAVTDNYCH